MFGREALTNPFEVGPAHQPQAPVQMRGGRLVFLAPAEAKLMTELLKVSVDTWDTNLDHPLLAHSDPDAAASTTYSDVVRPPS